MCPRYCGKKITVECGAAKTPQAAPFFKASLFPREGRIIDLLSATSWYLSCNRLLVSAASLPSWRHQPHIAPCASRRGKPSAFQSSETRLGVSRDCTASTRSRRRLRNIRITISLHRTSRDVEQESRSFWKLNVFILCQGSDLASYRDQVTVRGFRKVHKLELGASNDRSHTNALRG